MNKVDPMKYQWLRYRPTKRHYLGRAMSPNLLPAEALDPNFRRLRVDDQVYLTKVIHIAMHCHCYYLIIITFDNFIIIYFYLCFPFSVGNYFFFLQFEFGFKFIFQQRLPMKEMREPETILNY